MPLGPIMLDLESTVVSSEEKVLLEHPLVGGVILFTRNYESAEQIRSLISQIRTLRPELLIAVDQEGGRVQRFQGDFTRIPAMQRFLPLYRKNAQAALSIVKDTAWLMSVELLAVGVDFSFAPVLDLDDSACEVIADRSFSNQASEVCALAEAWLDGMHEAGMSTTGKHFPGHGGVTEDSHLALPVDKRSLESLAENDLIPFVELQEKLDGIMPAHILFPEIDAKQPVGFSSYWLQTILRNDLQFNGVIFSDDLTMEGAAAAGNYPERATLALEAGCDMLLVCNNRQGVLDILDNVSIDISPDSSKRIEKMRAREYLTQDTVTTSSRWKLTKQLLQTFSS